jgi:WD40 repeat protein
LEGTVAIARNLQLLGSHATEWQYNSMKRNLDFCLRFTNDTAESLLRHMGRNSIEHDLLPLCESLQKPLRFWTGHGRNALIDEKILSTGNDYLDQLSKLQSVEPVLSVTSKERHSSPILSMKFSHDQRLIVSGSEDGTVRIWNTWNLRENIRDLSLRKLAGM